MLAGQQARQGSLSLSLSLSLFLSISLCLYLFLLFRLNQQRIVAPSSPTNIQLQSLAWNLADDIPV